MDSHLDHSLGSSIAARQQQQRLRDALVGHGWWRRVPSIGGPGSRSSPPPLPPLPLQFGRPSQMSTVRWPSVALQSEAAPVSSGRDCLCMLIILEECPVSGPHLGSGSCPSSQEVLRGTKKLPFFSVQSRSHRRAAAGPWGRVLALPLGVAHKPGPAERAGLRTEANCQGGGSLK